MTKHLFYAVVLCLLTFTAFAQDVISISEARIAGMGSTVTVEGIVLNGSELGPIRYIQDESAGIAIYNPGGVDATVVGDLIRVTGELSEFNNLLQITEVEALVEFEIISSGNDLPEPQTHSVDFGFDEAFEGQLVRFTDIFFAESGNFQGNTNYEINGDSGSGQLRVSNGTDIGGQAIPTDAVSVIGIMGQYQDTYQLLPRSAADLGIEIVVNPPADLMTIAEARMLDLGSPVQIRGIITSGPELGAIRYIQDATGGLAIYNPGGIGDIAMPGDEIEITGTFSEFNELQQITEDSTNPFEYEILSSGNELPAPNIVTIGSGFSESYESTIVQFENTTIDASGTFEGNTNYDISDDSGSAQIRVNSNSNIAGTSIPTEAGTITGIMSQYQSNYQLLPRSTSDLDFGGGVIVDPPTGLISIAEARMNPVGNTVTIKGIITNGEELGVIRYVEDGTGGIGIYNPEVGEATGRGDSIIITGQISEFANLLEITDEGGEFNYTVLNTGNELPTPQTEDLIVGFFENFEGQLMRFEGVRFTDSGTFAGNTNYSITQDFDDYFEVRVNLGSNIVDTPIPGEIMNMVGIMSQYNDNYQLLVRDLADFEFIGNPPVISSAIQQSNLEQDGFTVSFETLNEGNTVLSYGLTEELEMGTIDDATDVTSHSTDISGLEPGNIYYVQVTSTSETGDVSSSPVIPMATVSESSGEILVYFNESVDHSVSTGVDAMVLEESISDTLIAYIDRAKYTLDMCMYTFDNINNILEALQAAGDRGVECRFVVDGEFSPAIYNLLPGEDKRKRPTGLNGIMHNKFVVIDAESEDPNDAIVWTGSTNFTNNQLKVDPNHVIIFQDQSLAKGFTLEFQEMLDGSFSYEKTENTPVRYIVGGKDVEAYFAPSDNVRARMKDEIRTADENLFFAILSFTRTDIAYEMVEESQEGTFVAGIMDENNMEFSAAVYDVLYEELGDNVLEDNNGYIFHHKYFIVDHGADESLDPLVWTGSYNWSNAAEFRNDENSVVVHDATIANIFFQEFVRRFEDAGGVYLSVEEEETKWMLQAFPNPTNTVLNVGYGVQNGQENLKVEVSSIAGQSMWKQVVPATSLGKFTIDTADWTPGVYVLKVNEQTKKFVVSH